MQTTPLILRNYEDDLLSSSSRITELFYVFQAIRRCGNDYDMMTGLAGIGTYLADDWIGILARKVESIKAAESHGGQP